MSAFDWISSPADLEQLIDELVESPEYALDTEFHRERTYYPRLALVQVATAQRVALVDPLAVDVSALQRAFEAPGLCVMHASSQDLEILLLECSCLPSRIFDTQVAALFVGYRTASLGKLVEDLLGVTLDKSSQLSDWTRRPLPESDQRYAASDVTHLIDLKTALTERLEAAGRLPWAEEEIERLRTKDRMRPDPDTLWWKLRGKSKLGGRARGVAQALARWRDELAERQNRPPRTVLSDMALLSLAQRPPRAAQDLRGIRNFDLRRFKHTDELLDTIARGAKLSKDNLKLPPKKPANLPEIDGVASLCIAWLTKRARDEGIDPSVLGTRDDVTSLVLDKDSRLARGWRHSLVGRELRSIIDGSAALRAIGTDLELLDRTTP
ncbi:MAG: HRDC domain-containing protein [Myxococcota bacterium]